MQTTKGTNNHLQAANDKDWSRVVPRHKVGKHQIYSAYPEAYDILMSRHDCSVIEECVRHICAEMILQRSTKKRKIRTNVERSRIDTEEEAVEPHVSASRDATPLHAEEGSATGHYQRKPQPEEGGQACTHEDLLRIVDLGCGTGRLIRMALPYARAALVTDRAKGMLNHCRWHIRGDIEGDKAAALEGRPHQQQSDSQGGGVDNSAGATAALGGRRRQRSPSANVKGIASTEQNQEAEPAATVSAALPTHCRRCAFTRVQERYIEHETYDFINRFKQHKESVVSDNKIPCSPRNDFSDGNETAVQADEEGLHCIDSLYFPSSTTTHQQTGVFPLTSILVSLEDLQQELSDARLKSDAKDEPPQNEDLQQQERFVEKPKSMSITRCADLILCGWSLSSVMTGSGGWGDPSVWQPRVRAVLASWHGMIDPATGGCIFVTETLGNFSDTPVRHNPLHDFIESDDSPQLGFRRLRWCRTDYVFLGEEECDRLCTFFFGKKTAQRVLQVHREQCSQSKVEAGNIQAAENSVPENESTISSRSDERLIRFKECTGIWVKWVPPVSLSENV